MNESIAEQFAADLRTDQIQEASYLVQEKTHIYRPIVAYLYDRMQDTETGWVTPHEIAQFIRASHPAGFEYDETECERDLRALDRWGTVLSEQDNAGATTLEEFVRAAKIYQISERGRLIERAIRDLEQAEGVHGSLDPGRLKRMWRAIELLHGILQNGTELEDLASVETHWNDVRDARSQFEEQAIRYLRDLGDRSADETDVEVFSRYRKLLQEYLHAFLIDLKDVRARCEGLFEDWRRAGFDQRLIEALARNDMRRGFQGSPEAAEAAVRPAVRQLLAFPSPDGTARILEKKTLARLTMLLGRVERIVLERQSVANRRQDLERLAAAFRHAPSDAFADQLASVAFGWGCPSHMHEYQIASEDLSPTESVWAQPPWMVELRPQLPGNPRLSRVTPARDRTRRQAELRREKARLLEQERRFWDHIFAEGKVVLDELRLPDAEALNQITQLVRDCIRSEDRSVWLSDGSQVRLILPADTDAMGRVLVPGGIYYTRQFTLSRSGGE
jgi:uncharacterized protein (TIGR02677 family)